MGYKKDDPFQHGRGQVKFFQKIPCQRLTFCFLVSAVCISVFFPAQRSGNVMDKGGNFQNILCIRVQSLLLSD